MRKYNLDNLRVSLSKAYYLKVRTLDGSSIDGVVFESPILAFRYAHDSEVLENSIVKFFNAIIRNAISTYGQVIDFEETPNLDRMVLTRVPWKNCTFLNFDKTKLERKYFFGTFDNCEFDNIYFTTRDLRITTGSPKFLMMEVSVIHG